MLFSRCRSVAYVVVAGLVAGIAIPAQAQLGAGDIAVIAYNSDNDGTIDDSFAWVALTDITANTTINFTDSSWQGFGPGGFRSTEHLDAGGPMTWTHSSAVTAGTVIRYSGSGAETTMGSWSLGTVGGTARPNLSTSGDQIFAFTGTTASPNFLYGLQFAHATGIVVAPTVSSSTNTTNTPGSLSSAAGTMVNVGNFDNGFYNGSTSGTAETVLANIANPSNWSLTNTGPITPSNWVTSFSISGAAAAPEPGVLVLMLPIFGGVILRRRAIRN